MWSRQSKTITDQHTSKVEAISYVGITRDSTLAEHGLDSLDSIEIAMQLEEDLGYRISAETLPQFGKVKHFINYIQQVEAFKAETNRSPLAWWCYILSYRIQHHPPPFPPCQFGVDEGILWKDFLPSRLWVMGPQYHFIYSKYYSY